MRHVLRAFLLLAVVSLVSLPALAAPNSSGCAAVGVSTSPDTVTAGNGFGIYGSISNCSDRRERYTVVVSTMSDCGQRITIASFRLAFKPGENRMYGVSHTTTTNTCSGPCNVTVEVLDNGGVIASASTTVTMLN